MRYVSSAHCIGGWYVLVEGGCYRRKAYLTTPSLSTAHRLGLNSSIRYVCTAHRLGPRRSIRYASTGHRVGPRRSIPQKQLLCL
eukprot:3339020-Rhodomonas_salina.1